MFQEMYTAEEWHTLQFAPLWVFTAIASTGKKNDEKKTEALAKELSEWAQYKEPLVQEVLLSVGKNLSEVIDLYKADTRDVMEGLKDVADLLGKKATEEQCKNFKGAMLLIGRNIAEASGGGLFGHGNKISTEEKAALVLIGMSLRIA